MAEVVGIKFREDGRIYSFGANGIKLNQGDYAVVETARGTECGMVAKGNHNLSESELVKP
jgi:cell fate regulator YaaT (PSP1 superfamily)